MVKGSFSEARLVSLHHSETYDLGLIRRTYTLDGETINDEEIPLVVTYIKNTISNIGSLKPRTRGTVLGERLRFEDHTGRVHCYFRDHELYAEGATKWTNSNGLIKRVQFKLRREKSFDLSLWDEDIVAALGKLPQHVRKVVMD